MSDKPRTVDGYSPEVTKSARAAVLTSAIVIGDLLEEVVVVGGLVPSLLVEEPPEGVDFHAGTSDVDLGLHFALLDDEKYAKIAERFRSANAQPGMNEQGNPTPATWVLDVGGTPVVIDFLIGDTGERKAKDANLKFMRLQADLHAFIADAVPLAFHDKVKVTIEGKTADGSLAKRQIAVAGPASFVALKALAWKGRGHPKDLYDLCWILEAHPDGAEVIAENFVKLPEDLARLKDAKARAIQILSDDFATAGHVGPRSAAAFLKLEKDAVRVNNNHAIVQRFLKRHASLFGQSVPTGVVGQ